MARLTFFKTCFARYKKVESLTIEQITIVTVLHHLPLNKLPLTYAMYTKTIF